MPSGTAGRGEGRFVSAGVCNGGVCGENGVWEMAAADSDRFSSGARAGAGYWERSMEDDGDSYCLGLGRGGGLSLDQPAEDPVCATLNLATRNNQERRRTATAMAAVRYLAMEMEVDVTSATVTRLGLEDRRRQDNRRSGQQLVSGIGYPIFSRLRQPEGEIPATTGTAWRLPEGPGEEWRARATPCRPEPRKNRLFITFYILYEFALGFKIRAGGGWAVAASGGPAWLGAWTPLIQMRRWKSLAGQLLL